MLCSTARQWPIAVDFRFGRSFFLDPPLKPFDEYAWVMCDHPPPKLTSTVINFVGTLLDSHQQEIAVIDESMTITWVPEYPSPYIPATMIIGLLGAVLLLQRTREH